MASVLDATLLNGKTATEPLRKIAVLPTGAGKSLCWMLPAVLIEGITIAVFPLLSLISDQKRRLDQCGISSVVLKGGQSKAERNKLWTELETGAVKVVLANPEVLQTANVEHKIQALEPVFLAVDETHTVSQWGETFRPACAGLGKLVEKWKPQAVLALTATAGPQIRSRIKELLFNGEAPDEALANPDRPAIRYGVLPSLSRNHTLELLVREKDRPLIVFGSTRPSVEMAARLLRFRLNDDEIRFYHAGLTPQEKSKLEEWFLNSQDGILCATCAYGLGVDKANVRTVVHLSPPASTEAYLQESGRASRDKKGAEAWLITTPEDAQILSEPEINKVQITDSKTIPGAEEAARTRRRGMIRYAISSEKCRREVLLEALGIEAQDCSGCDICGGEPWIEAPEQETILRVTAWNNGRFRKGELARILIGRQNVEIRRLNQDLTRGFGALSGWELEDAEEALNVLLKTGKLHEGKRLWRKGKLSNTRKFTKDAKK